MSKSPLEKFIESAPPENPLLPLFHSTESYKFFEIIEGKQIIAKSCPVLHEDLIYLFYGRASYRVAQSDTSDANYIYPICFIFKPDAIAKVKRIYPFDTGAYKNSIYQEHIPSIRFDLNKFLLSSLEAAQKLVAKFFGSNENYFRGVPHSRAEIGFSFSHFEVEAYHDLISSRNTRADDRKSAIEIQVADTIDIKDKLLTIILPESAMRDSEIRHIILHELKVTPITYPEFFGGRPTEYHGDIRGKLFQYLKSKGYL